LKRNELTDLITGILPPKKKTPKPTLEAEIDRLVYELYDLNDEEIEIVEESVG